MNNEREILQLVQGCLDGDRQCQESVYATYSRRMFGVCMRYARSREEAEDFLQDAFLKVFSRLHQFKAAGSFEGWIRKIVIHTIMENLRKKSLMFKVVDIDEAEDEGGREPFPDSVSIWELVTLIQELSPGCRAVFNLYAIEGYTHAEIAGLLGIRTGTSKSHYFTARRILRERIELMNKEILQKS